jgi:hypothetical protein
MMKNNIKQSIRFYKYTSIVPGKHHGYTPTVMFKAPTVTDPVDVTVKRMPTHLH